MELDNTFVVNSSTGNTDEGTTDIKEKLPEKNPMRLPDVKGNVTMEQHR